MTIATRKIIWQFWNNPFGPDEPEFVAEDEAHPDKWGDEPEDESRQVHIRPVIATPMGFMPVNYFQSFAKAFEFWMGHTNFDITHHVKDVIEAVPGVEILDVLTRYCFRIAVGKAFDGNDVKLAIQKALNAMPPKPGEQNPFDLKLDEDTSAKVALLRSHLKEKFPYWTIYVLPNGEIDVSTANSRDGYDVYLDLYQRAQELVGGIIYTHA